MASNAMKFSSDEMLSILASDLGFDKTEIETLKQDPKVAAKLAAFDEEFKLTIDNEVLERAKKEGTFKDVLMGKKEKYVVALKDIKDVVVAYMKQTKDKVKPTAKKGVGKTAVVAGKGMQGVGKGIIAVGEAVLKAGISTEVYGLSMIEDINIETNNFALNKVKEMLDADKKLTPEQRQERFSKAAKKLGVQI